ncbi:T9SS type A sorting domain-containing protein [Pontibacter sp. KCTC 32443]|uniref:T9SS type A sorting domain-containing protein n=1 Tax=Pontibacter TaxID=323449 RepID=UPI00164D83EB|nr:MULTISPECIES: T9SS type A sorting domain-containing protein [Pontibacter]MBC5774472.1 T9SS type A sorting domain-containing protein [Pontibacter sp. KCTC 32443]
MGISTLTNKLVYPKICLILFLWIGIQVSASAQTTTSWTGAGTDWATASNWTAGVPNATTHVIIGDANFTGNKQPKIDQAALAECLSLTVGGVKAADLVVSNDKGFTVHGNVIIASNGRIENEGTYFTIKGNWTNNGTFTDNLYIKGNSPNARSTQYPTMEFTGANARIGGTGLNSFNKLVLTGSTILDAGITMIARSNTSGNVTVQPQLHVNSSLDPQTNLVTVPNVAGAELIVGPTATLYVKGATYFSNYSRSPTTMYTTSTINYAGGDQTIESALVYGVLRVSGTGTKRLNGNTRVFGAQDTGLHIDAGVLDLESYTLDKDNSPGASLSIVSGATLRIGGTNTFPANYGTNTLDANSTVEYYGTNQTVANVSYGHLLLSTSGIKTMPATAMTVKGNLTSSGTVSYTAGAPVNVAGNVTIGTGTTFNGGSAIHTIGGNWAANGTFTGNASTVLMTGSNKIISSTAGATEFFNLTLNGTGITITVPALTIRGDLNAPGGLAQVADGNITMTNTVSKSISGANLNFQNLTIDGIVTTAANPTLNGNFTVNAGKTFTASAGTVTMAGLNKSIAGSGSKTFFNLTIANATSTAASFTVNAALSGSSSLTASAGTATFGSTSTFANTHYLNDVAITGTSMRMLANANLYVAGTMSKGASSVFDVTTATPNTVYYNGLNPQPLLATTYHHLVLTNTGAKTAGGAITVNGNSTIDAGATLNAGSFNHNLYGNWVNNGSFNHNNGTVTFTGGANTSITGATFFNNLALNKTSMGNAVTLLTDATANTLQMTNGIMQTGANKIIILNTRSGNGWVIGTVNRQHVFNDGEAYAFNSPFSQLSFASPAGITDVSITVAEESIAGFTTGAAINRKYTIAIPAGTYTNGTLQLQYNDTDLNGNNEAGLQLYRYESGIGRWLTRGRSALSSTDNWVRRNSFTNLQGVWTMSANPNIYRWVGGTSIAWELPANWENITDGFIVTADVAPLSNDEVILSEVVPVNQPTINSDVTVSKITYKSIAPTNLTVGSGSLTVTGNMATAGAGTGIQHTLAAGSQTINIGGNLVLNDGSAGNSLSVISTSGTVNVTGSIQHRETGSIELGTGNLNISGDYIYVAGNFAAGTGTVTYNGTGAQVVAGLPYHHLTVSKTAGTATYTAAATQSITGNLSVNNAGTLALAVPTLNVAGNVSITAGQLQANAATIDLKGNWSTAGTASFTAGTSTVIFSGSTDQTVSATNFNNLTKTAANTLTTTGISTINGSLDVQAGTLLLNGHTLNRSSAGGTFTLANDATLRINNASTFPANFAANTLGLTSTVIYSGGNAAIAPVTYGYLTLQDGANRALQGATRAANLMTVASGATLANNNNTLTLDNNLVNDGTINAPATNLVFTAATASLGGSGTTTIKDLTVNAGAGLTISKNITLNGNLTNNGTGINASANQVEFTGAAAATITSATPLTINQLLIRKSNPSNTVTLSADITDLQSINVASGTFDATNKTLTKKAVAGTTLTVANAATMKVGGTSTLPVLDSYTLDPGSTIVYNGSNQSIKSVQYGHLDLQNFGTAIFEAGIAQIAGNFTKGNEATVITPATIEYNGTAAQSIVALDYNNLILSSTGAKTFAAGNHRIAEALTKPGSGAVNARAFATTVHYTKAGDQDVLPLNYNNLTLSGSGAKKFTGTTGINGAFTLGGTATADLATNENTIVFDGATQTVPALNYKNLSIAAAGAKTLAGSINVEKALALTAGELRTGSGNNIILDAINGSISETATGYVTGTVEITRNLSSGLAQTFGGIGLTVTPATGTPGATKVTRVTGTGVGNGKSIIRSFKVVPQDTTQDLNATIALSYLDHELNGLAESDLAVYFSPTGGNDWKLQSASAAPNESGNSVSLAGVQRMAYFTLGGRNTPLPVELVYFKAHKSGTNAVLEWKTAMEQNNSGFEVQASVDGYTYQKVRFIKSQAGTSATAQTYTYTDNRNGKSGIVYYRLKQIDLNGTAKIYSPQTVNFGAVTQSTITAYPNPFVSEVKVAIEVVTAGKATLTLYSTAGKVLMQHEEQLAEGASELQLNLDENLPRGLYLLIIEQSGKAETLKLIKN